MRNALARLVAFGVPALLLMGQGCKLTPPPPEAGQAPTVTIMDADGKAVTGIRQKHVIGKSPCPTEMAPIRIEVEGDAHPPKAVPKTDAKWLKLPDEVTPGQWFIPMFTCDIDDLTSHVEEADVTFGWKFGDASAPEDAPSGPQAVDPGAYKKLDVKLRARTEVCKSFSTCPPDDAQAQPQGVNTVTWAKPCPTDSACAPKSADGGWFGTAPEETPKAE